MSDTVCIFSEINSPGGYNYPNRILLNHYGGFESKSIPPSDDPDATVVIRVLENNGTSSWVEEIKQGPTFRQYKIGFKRGTLRSSGLKHNDDFAQNICVSSVRIIPSGQDNPFITIEVPNKKRFTIGFDKMVDSLKASKANIPMALGMDVNGELSVIDVAQMHHVLILGDTGSGKTVFINSFLNSILFSRTPDQVRILLADLGDYGLSVYNGIPHLLSSVMTKPEDVLKAMEDLCSEMERRMVLFRESSTNSIKVFNDVAGKNNESRLPYIVFVIDEYAPIMIGFKNQFEHWIKRITAVARFCGIHFVLTTRSVCKDVVSSVISGNIPTVINFRTKDASELTTSVIRKDSANLLGRGDFLFSRSYSGTAQRFQGAYIDLEVGEIVSSMKKKY